MYSSSMSIWIPAPQPPERTIQLLANQLKIGSLWEEFHAQRGGGSLLSFVQRRREEIAAQKERWRRQVEELWQSEPLIEQELKPLLRKGRLERCSLGVNGCYFLLDKSGNPCWVVKPEEGAMTLNNPVENSSPFRDPAFRMRPFLPPYDTPIIEYCAYEIARIAGFSELIPRTLLAIIERKEFYDLSEELEGELRQRFLRMTGAADREKLCSVQRYLPDAEELGELVQEWLKRELPEEEMASLINQESFERANLLVWLLFDTDAHSGNFLALWDEESWQYHIVKVDNGYCLPLRNNDLRNFLYHLPNADLPLSTALVEKVLFLPVEPIVQLLKSWGLESRVYALRERVRTLKLALRENPSLSIAALDERIQQLHNPLISPFLPEALL